jgi:hypothetical protein
VKPEFYIERQGKRFVLFAGLLDEAHSVGLKRIDTELLQVPNGANGDTAITKATVELEDGRLFSGIGDANPNNVGRAIAPHLIRMSETRAKARALRDAVNVGATSLEELGEDVEVGAKPQGEVKRSRDAESKPEGEERRATEKQVLYLSKLIEDTGHSLKDFQAKHGTLGAMSAKDASGWIKKFTEYKQRKEA